MRYTGPVVPLLVDRVVSQDHLRAILEVRHHRRLLGGKAAHAERGEQFVARGESFYDWIRQFPLTCRVGVSFVRHVRRVGRGTTLLAAEGRKFSEEFAYI